MLPAIDDPLALDAFLTARAGQQGGLRLLLHPGEGSAALPAHCTTATLLVGPEGGFSDAEVAAAIGAGYHALQLGPRILRTETAPLVALALVQARWGDLSL